MLIFLTEVLFTDFLYNSWQNLDTYKEKYKRGISMQIKMLFKNKSKFYETHHKHITISKLSERNPCWKIVNIILRGRNPM